MMVRVGTCLWRGTCGPKEVVLAIAVGLAVTAATGGARAEDQAGSGDGDDEKPMVLAPIVVEGERGVVTEGTGSYATERATVGSKQPAGVRDVPQAVTVITRQRLDDGNATTLEEAGYLIPNVSTATGDLFIGSLYSRGHEVFTYNVDGAPRPFLSLYGTAPDLVFFDRVEVLSGPSGVFQGSGEPVGTINLVRKRALDGFAASAAGSYGTFGAFRGEADVTGALLQDGSLRGRIVAYGETEESFVDVTESDRIGVYGTLEQDIGDRTTISLGGIHEEQDVVRFSGLPTFGDGEIIDFDRDTFIGAPYNNFHSRASEGFLEMEHELDFGGVLKVMGRYYDKSANNFSALAFTPVDRETGNFQAFVFAREYDEKTAYLDANVTSPFSLLQREGEFAVGVDYRYTDQTTLQNFDFSLGTQNIDTFDPGDLPEPSIDFPGVGPGFALNTETTTSEYGAYAQGRLEIVERLKLTLGVRVAHYDSTTDDTGRDIEVSDLTETRAVPYAGLSFDATDNVTLYTSYSEIFQPQTEQRADGSQLDPIIGRQVEVGAKASLLEGGLSAQVAAFWLRDQNRAEADPDPDNVGAFLDSGEAVTRGVEIFVAGRPYPGFDVTAGYSFVETELETDPTPEQSFTIWGKYTLESGPLRGLYLGAGLRAVSSFESRDEDIRINADAYAVVDAAIGYAITINNGDKYIVKRVGDDYVIGSPNVESATLKILNDDTTDPAAGIIITSTDNCIRIKLNTQPLYGRAAQKKFTPDAYFNIVIKVWGCATTEEGICGAERLGLLFPNP